MKIRIKFNDMELYKKYLAMFKLLDYDVEEDIIYNQFYVKCDNFISYRDEFFISVKDNSNPCWIKLNDIYFVSIANEKD